MNRVVSFSFIIVTLSLCMCPFLWAETSWKASLALSEEYTDNAAQTYDGEEDYITALHPGLSFNYEGARLLFQSAYLGDYRYYAMKTQDEEFNHDLSARGVFEAVEDLLYFETTERYSLVNRDRTRGDVVEGDSTSGLVKQNVFFFSPYFTPRFSDRASLKTGYAYSNIWAEDGSNSKDRHRGFVDGNYGLSSSATLLYGASYTMDVLDEYTLDRYISYLGGQYSYAENSGFYLKLGPQYTRNRSNDNRSTDLFWDAGYNHDFGYLLFSLTSGLTVEDDPETGESLDRQYVTVTLSKTWERTKVSLFSTLEDYESLTSGSSISTPGSEKIRRTTLGANFSHEITDRLSGSLGLRHDFDDSDANTKRWYANLGFAYSLTETLSLSSWYRFRDISSEDEDKDYSVNSVSVQVSKTF